jgi:predicted nuclease with TOPRIM domain
MPCTANPTLSIAYASLLSELRAEICQLKKADATLQKRLQTQHEELSQLRRGFDDLKEKLESINVMIKIAGLTGVQLDLPDNLRLTYNTLSKLAVADAQQVANVTQRARAVESAYLNQLVRMNVASTKRHGRVKRFNVSQKLAQPPRQTT